jgi:hypothetical protein
LVILYSNFYVQLLLLLKQKTVINIDVDVWEIRNDCVCIWFTSVYLYEEMFSAVLNEYFVMKARLNKNIFKKKVVVFLNQRMFKK